MTAGDDMRSTETLLRDSLSEHTRDLSVDAEFVNATIDHSVASLRKTRGRQFALGTVTVAALVALVASQAPSLVDNRSTPPVSPDEPRIVDSYAWAESLPRGADAEVAYVQGRTLVTGSNAVDLRLRADGQRVLAPLRGGWLASFEPPETADAKVYGYLAPNGEFTQYAYQPGKGLDTGFAGSPDGTEAAYAGAIVDAYSPGTSGEHGSVGHKIADLPENAVWLVEWTAAGVVYLDTDHAYWLWSPGDQAVRLPFDKVLPGGYGYTRDGDCVAVAPVRTPSTLAPSAYNLCGRGDPLTVSPGRRALMSDGEFVNLEAGVDFLTLPDSVDPTRLQLHWESDDNLILVIPDDAVGQPNSSVLVRCTVSSGLCERASDPLSPMQRLAALPLPEQSAH
jgi:hypothetical protein